MKCAEISYITNPHRLPHALTMNASGLNYRAALSGHKQYFSESKETERFFCPGRGGWGGLCGRPSTEMRTFLTRGLPTAPTAAAPRGHRTAPPTPPSAAQQPPILFQPRHPRSPANAPHLPPSSTSPCSSLAQLVGRNGVCLLEQC